MQSLQSMVKEFYTRHALAEVRMVVAVSGGPDSVALWRSLHAVLPMSHLVIAHLNHQLRGAASDADEDFVRRLHSKLAPAADRSMELICKRCDLRRCSVGENLEATARRIRYDWLAKVAVESNSGVVATGHTADDQAETILHRIVRGTGLKGLCGIAVQRPLAPGVSLIRPMLTVTRTDVLDYLMSIEQDYCVDDTNSDTTYTRNRIRRELLPLLREKFNPEIVTILGRLAEQAASAFQEHRFQAEQLLLRSSLPPVGSYVILDRSPLLSASPNSVRECLRLLWTQRAWPMNDMSFRAWNRLAQVVCGKRRALDLPGGIHAICRGRVIQIGPRHIDRT